MSAPRQPRPACKRDKTDCRSVFFAALLLVLFQIPIATAQPVQLSEDEAVARALAIASLSQAWNAEVAEHEAQAQLEELWPNPSVGYSHEQSFEDPDPVGEDFVVLQQTLPLSGRHKIGAEIARRRAATARLANHSEALVIATDVRRSFYEILVLQRRLEVYAEWLETMREMEATLQRRIDAGESAPYDLERLQKEIADIIAARNRDRAELERQEAELSALIGAPPDADLDVRGALMPTTVPDAEALRARIADHPDIRAANTHLEAASLIEELASRAWIPEPTLSGGYRGATVAGEHFPGFVAGIEVPLPFFTRARGERALADAMRNRWENRRELQKRQMLGRAMGLAGKVRRLKEATQTYQTEGVKRAEGVVKTARLAYLGGELGILELIDAYRGLVDARLAVVEMSAEARAAEVELRRNLTRNTPEEGSE